MEELVQILRDHPDVWQPVGSLVVVVVVLVLAYERLRKPPKWRARIENGVLTELEVIEG